MKMQGTGYAPCYEFKATPRMMQVTSHAPWGGIHLAMVGTSRPHEGSGLPACVTSKFGALALASSGFGDLFDPSQPFTGIS